MVADKLCRAVRHWFNVEFPCGIPNGLRIEPATLILKTGTSLAVTLRTPDRNFPFCPPADRRDELENRLS